MSCTIQELRRVEEAGQQLGRPKDLDCSAGDTTQSGQLNRPSDERIQQMRKDISQEIQSEQNGRSTKAPAHNSAGGVMDTLSPSLKAVYKSLRYFEENREDIDDTFRTLSVSASFTVFSKQSGSSSLLFSQQCLPDYSPGQGGGLLQVLEQTEDTGIETILLKNQLRWAEHISRMEDDQLPKFVLYGAPLDDLGSTHLSTYVRNWLKTSGTLEFSAVLQQGPMLETGLSSNAVASKNMSQINQTMVTYFIIMGISDKPELQIPIFLLILFIYLFCFGGNMTILLLVCLDPQLHTPMYFFLGNLSFLDISTATITLHKILFSFISGDKKVSFLECMTQMYMYICLESDVLLILTAMSYDRYVAICNPLHYYMVMNRKRCALLATVCWMLSFIQVIPTLCALLGFKCYNSNIVNHFFCDLVPLKELTCSDTSAVDLYVFIQGGLITCITTFMLTFISYIFIITAILKIRSSTGRRKAFYTCSSHLTVIILLYTTLSFQYFRPKSIVSLDSNKLFSLFNTAAVPILNPLIYSMKNKDVKSALRRLLRYYKTVV
ncbi:olfactory receptor 8D1-like [Discoglossus pictus]